MKLKSIKRKMPLILTIVSSIGVVTTAILVAKDSEKAIKVKKRLEKEKGEELTRVEYAKAVIPVYIPAILTGTATIICICGINVFNKKNQASLLAAYAVMADNYQKYRQAAIAVYGEDANEKIYAEMADEVYISSEGFLNRQSIYSSDLEPDSENILFFDAYSKNYFNAKLSAVINAQYHVNRNLALRGHATINEYYAFLGLEPVDEGDYVGWDMSILYDDGVCWLDFNNSKATMDDGLVCIITSVTSYEPELLELEDVYPF